jgi:ubiquinone/menaquinone biosynthesis C-methylase UbiE
MLQEYLDAMHIDTAATVLDIGCGTGLAARAIARRAGFSGRVTGLDLSPYLVSTAQGLARDEGVADRTEFRACDVRRLDFADSTFDGVVAHTLLSHVDDPLAVLREAARVLKVGGMLGIFDGDYASLTFDHADPVKGKIYDDLVVSAVVANPRVMRQMPRLLRAEGLELVTSFSYVLSEAGRPNVWSSAIETYRRLIPIAGTMTQEEADAWAAALHSDSEAGIFFGSSNYYAYVARRL